MTGAKRTAWTVVRRGIKATVFAAALILAAPLIVLCSLEQHIWGGESLFVLSTQLLAAIPGEPGCWLRGAFYFGALEQCSWEAHFGYGTLFSHRGARIGSRVSTGAYCVFGHAQIGDDVMIGSRVSIPSGKRQHLDDDGRLVPTSRFDQVSVGSDTWVGEGAIILADVGKGCIVSAGAVVTQPSPAGQLIGGNPARAIRPVEMASERLEV